MWNSSVDAFASDTLATTLDEVAHKTKTPKVALDQAQTLVGKVGSLNVAAAAAVFFFEVVRQKGRK